MTYRVFLGYDHRQPVSNSVLVQSLILSSSVPLAITPLVLNTLPITRTGLTPFTWSRFLVPWLCKYEGRALFLDTDMVVTGDVKELFDLSDDNAVMVVKNEKTFEWASVMLFNCAHPDNRALTPEFVETTRTPLHKIGWTESVGELPAQWNHLVGYDKPRDDPKLIHYTMGIPAFPETVGMEHTDVWAQVHRAANSALPWADLMEKSVHAKHVHARLSGQQE